MGKWCFLPYDFDTAIGINNEGTLAFSYELEDIDQVAGADVFNGQDSVLWVNLRQAYQNEIKAMYQELRSKGLLSYEDTERRFEEHQAKWPEAVFNEDAYFKYLQPLIEDNSAAYLSMLQGSKAEQRKWWLYNRYRYLDSKYNAGDALSDVITVRGYAKADITVTPYADIYASVKYGSYLVQQRALRGASYTLECPLDNVNDTEIYVYSASQLKDVGDLSGLMVGYAEFSLATKLQSLKLGDSSSGYSNTNLTDLHLGNNVLLRTLDVRNCPNLTQAVDVSGCANLEHVYFDGTGITGLLLPVGGILKTLHLPATITNLTIRNQMSLQDLSIPSYAGISTLRLENVSSAVDSKAILDAIPANSRVRLIGINWAAGTADKLMEIIALLDSMRGLDEAGNNTDMAQVSGTISVDTVTGAQLAEIAGKYPDIKVAYQHVTSNLYFYNDDGSTLLYTQAIVDGGDGTYSGSTPTKSSTAQYTYSFSGWSRKPGGSADSTALKAVVADRNVYAAFTATIRRYTVYFYNGSTLLQKVENVACGSSATYTGDTPVSSEGSAEDYPFLGFIPDGKNITGNTSCYAQFGSPIEETEITDSWENIIASCNNGTYSKYKVGNYKKLELDGVGTFIMQIVDKNIKTTESNEIAHLLWNSKVTPIPSRKYASFKMSENNKTYGEEVEVWKVNNNIIKNANITKKTREDVGFSNNKVVISYNCENKDSITFSVNAVVDGNSKLLIQKNCKKKDEEVLTPLHTITKGNFNKAITIDTTDCITVEIIIEYTPENHFIENENSVTVVINESDMNVVTITPYKNKKCLSYTQGASGIGGWEYSAIRQYLENTILPKMPFSVLKIKNTQYCLNKYNEVEQQETLDKIFILDYDSEIKKILYYKKNKPIVYSDINQTERTSWWIRGMRTSNYDVEKCAEQLFNGYLYNNGADVYAGIAIAFCT